MRHRTALVGLVALVALGSIAVAQDHRAADEHPASDRRGRDLSDDMPAVPLRVHEWGVWQLETNGRLSSRTTVAAEAPAFVHRAPAALPSLEELTPTALPPGLSGNETFDKPVVFLYADTALDVSVTVRVPRGRPWLYFPDAVLGRVRGAPSLRWTGQVLPIGVAVTGAALPDVPAAAVPVGSAAQARAPWWNALRAVNASPFVPTGSTSYEKFLYYDGEAPFPAGFRVRGNVVRPIAGRVEPVAWQLDGPHWTRLDVRGSQMTATDIGNMVALIVELEAQLHRAGLTQAESDALLHTWGRALFTGPRRIIWLMPRAAYDAMLPIAIQPEPLELVRVGLVIQRY